MRMGSILKSKSRITDSVVEINRDQWAVRVLINTCQMSVWDSLARDGALWCYKCHILFIYMS